MDPETRFLSGLIELQYGQKVEQKLKNFSHKVPWAHGWPENQKAFWNAEAFMWQRKIGKEKRRLIEQKLEFLQGKNNLDVGCGAYSYIPSVGIDFSEKMLQFNDTCSQKINTDLEEKLPLQEKTFDSATAIFVLNYLHKTDQLLQEIYRVLKEKGYLVVVLWSKRLNPLHQQKEQNHHPSPIWMKKITSAGFEVQFSEKEGIWFFIGQKGRKLIKD